MPTKINVSKHVRSSNEDSHEIINNAPRQYQMRMTRNLTRKCTTCERVSLSFGVRKKSSSLFHIIKDPHRLDLCIGGSTVIFCSSEVHEGLDAFELPYRSVETFTSTIPQMVWMLSVSLPCTAETITHMHMEIETAKHFNMLLA